MNSTGAGRPLSDSILSGITLCIIAVGTVIGNLLVMLAVILVRKLQTPSNFLIVSLALSDLLVGLVVMPITIINDLNGSWPFDEPLCDTYIAFDVLLCTASILNLCAISVDRYLAIIKPLRYAAKRTPKRMFLMITGVWLASALISIPPMIGFKEQWRPGNCGYSQNIYYQIYATAGAFYIPLIVMLVMYGRIFVLARRMAREDAKQKRISEPGIVSKANNEFETGRTGSLEQPSLLTNRVSLVDTPTEQAFDEREPIVNKNHSVKSNHKFYGRNANQSNVIDERYPLPPSEACRRRKPRPLQKGPNYMSVPNILPDSKFGATETSSNALEFEERVQMLRRLRAEFFAAPPSRHCSSLILSLRRTEDDRTEIKFLNASDYTEIPQTPQTPQRSPYGSPLHQSQSMRETSYKHKETPSSATTPRRSMPPPPVLSVSCYPEEPTYLPNQSRGSDAFTTLTVLEPDREPASQPPSVTTTPLQPMRPRPRPLHGVRRSLANTSEYSNKYHPGRYSSLGLPKTLFDRRLSSPNPSSHTYGNHTRRESKPTFIGRSASKLFNIGSEGNQRSRSGSWGSARAAAKKRKSRGHTETKAIRTLGVIMGCFCLCWIPFFIIALANPLAKMMGREELTSPAVSNVFLWLGYVNSTLNPIIYAIFNQEFRIPFKHILLCRCRGINARLRSQRYATEFGIGASTASCMAPPNVPGGEADVSSAFSKARPSNASGVLRRPTSDMTGNHAQYGLKTNPYVLQIPD